MKHPKKRIVSRAGIEKRWKLAAREFNTQFFHASKDGELVVHEGNNQYNILELVKKYGSPLRILFPFIIEYRVERLIGLFNHFIKESGYKGQFYYHYPMKVNQNKEIVLPLISEGANLETTSANELWIVKRLWEQQKFNSRIKVICNGPKTKAYLDLIAELKENGLDIIPIIEDVHEQEFLHNFRGQVGIRVDLDVKVHSRWDKRIERFGIPIDELYKMGKIKNLTILHYHVGSELEFEKDLLCAVRKAVDVYAEMKKTNPSLDTIDLGGGLSVNYSGKAKYASKSIVKRIVQVMKKMCDELGVQHPNIICEWGSYIVAPSQMTVFRVISEKNIPKANAKKWYVIDGSFQTHLLDTWAIHRQWHIVPASHLNDRAKNRVWLAGLSCDADDKYTAGGSYLLLPSREMMEGSQEELYLVMLDTGSYQDAFINHHCMNAAPMRIVCQDGEVKVIRRHQTAEDVGKLFGW